MQGVSSFIWIQIIFPLHKQLLHSHPLFKVLIVTLKTLGGDEIKCRYPNFVTRRKNQFSRPRVGNLKKVWREKMFSPESMTKLEDLTVFNLEIHVPYDSSLRED